MTFRIAALLAVTALTAGCGAHQAPGDPAACQVQATGPLLAATTALGPAPTPQGGRIVDGIYDAQWIHVHERPAGAGEEAVAPSFRVTYQIDVDERMTDHSEGTLVRMVDHPPAKDCKPGRVAGLGPALRVSLDGRMIEDAYTAAPEGLYVMHVQNGNGIAVTFYRRRP